VTDAPHGNRPPCAGEGPPCQGTCDGQVVDACVYPAGSECDRTCEDGEQTVSTCDGQGACVRGTPDPCDEFVCDEETLLCKSSCDSDADCADGLSCWADGTCGPSARCTSDRSGSVTAPHGDLENCRPYVCENGRCKTSCVSSDDCAAPNACDPRQHCVRASRDEGGCGCRTARGRDRSASLGEAFWLVLALALRRARRRAFAPGAVR
jgi:hypothetical protein